MSEQFTFATLLCKLFSQYFLILFAGPLLIGAPPPIPYAPPQQANGVFHGLASPLNNLSSWNWNETSDNLNGKTKFQWSSSDMENMKKEYANLVGENSERELQNDLEGAAILATHAGLRPSETMRAFQKLREEEKNPPKEFDHFGKMREEKVEEKMDQEKLRKKSEEKIVKLRNGLKNFQKGFDEKAAKNEMEENKMEEKNDGNGEEEGFSLGKYHTYEEMVEFMESLVSRHPQFIFTNTIGKSYQGRELEMIKFGYPSTVDNGDKEAVVSEKPIFLIDAGIHAREWIGPAIALHIMNAFVTDPEWHSLLHKIDVHIIPCLNPDGYDYSRNTNPNWRKTRSGPHNTTGICENGVHPSCRGVDANRNFPFHWGKSKASYCRCRGTYAGPSALSENESASLERHMRANVARIAAYLTLHAKGNALIHSWNHAKGEYPEGVEEVTRLGREMVQTIVKASGPGEQWQFRLGSGADLLYEASGTSQDFATHIGIKYSYTMELTMGFGYAYPESLINEYAKKVLPGIQVLARKVAEY